MTNITNKGHLELLTHIRHTLEKYCCCYWWTLSLVSSFELDNQSCFFQVSFARRVTDVSRTWFQSSNSLSPDGYTVYTHSSLCMSLRDQMSQNCIIYYTKITVL